MRKRNLTGTNWMHKTRTRFLMNGITICGYIFFWMKFILKLIFQKSDGAFTTTSNTHSIIDLIPYIFQSFMRREQILKSNLKYANIFISCKFHVFADVIVPICRYYSIKMESTMNKDNRHKIEELHKWIKKKLLHFLQIKFPMRSKIIFF